MRPRVLQGCSAATPFYCNYRWRADLVPPAGLQGGSDGRDPYGIDSSYLEIPGKGRYHLLSAKNARGQQSIQITPLDTKTWNVTGWHIISEPEYAWERNVSNSKPRELWIGDIAINEGPHVSWLRGALPREGGAVLLLRHIMMTWDDGTANFVSRPCITTIRSGSRTRHLTAKHPTTP